MSKLVTVKTFFNRHEAGIAQGLLKDQGIDSFILADDCGGLRPELKIGIDNVRLQVSEAAVGQAREILQVLEEDAPLELIEQINEEAEHVIPEQITRKEKAPGISIFVPIMIGFLFLIVYSFQATNKEWQDDQASLDCQESLTDKECSAKSNKN